ncbi:hypothetical protein CF394_06510 [Tetzosporium hominis]|uniref:Flagellar protein FlgN n=1 Tax=Tetzosporium hominis TaxID=2020506 RepID=A0A264W4C3_9BACL|nr:hypothetical protein [Tetzosporium hominis]OZS78405.1 hypothetical protein CF394_06510 [Tetzosporium hominis]
MSEQGTTMLHYMSELLDVAQKKQQAIVNREVTELDLLNKQEITLLKQLSQFERQSLTEVSEDVGSELVRYQLALREQLKVNEELLRDALQFTQHMLSQLTEQNDSPGYQPRQAQVQSRPMAFDHKA